MVTVQVTGFAFIGSFVYCLSCDVYLWPCSSSTFYPVDCFSIIEIKGFDKLFSLSGSEVPPQVPERHGCALQSSLPSRSWSSRVLSGMDTWVGAAGCRFLQHSSGSDEREGGCGPRLSHQVSPARPYVSAGADATSGAHVCPLLCSEDKMALFLSNLQSKLERNKVETRGSWLLHACGFPWIL